ncbi:MAG: RDD family protein, partial [Pseudomonadota bacterium]
MDQTDNKSDKNNNSSNEQEDGEKIVDVNISDDDEYDSEDDDEYEKQYFEYVSFYSRLKASIIDSFLCIIILQICNFVFVAILGGTLPSQKFSLHAHQKLVNMTAIDDIYLIYNTPLLTGYIIEIILQISLLMIIFGILWQVKNSPGKLFYKMHIVDAKTLEKPSKKQYILRMLGYIISSLPLMLGFVWMFF